MLIVFIGKVLQIFCACRLKKTPKIRLNNEALLGVFFNVQNTSF